MSKLCMGYAFKICSLTLPLREFWHTLTIDEHVQLVKVHDSPNPEKYKNDPIAVCLMQWL